MNKCSKSCYWNTADYTNETPVRMARIQDTGTTKCWWDVEQQDLAQCWWGVTCGRFMTKLNLLLPYDRAAASLVFIQITSSHTHVSQMFRTALLSLGNLETTKLSPAGGWTMSPPTKECDSAGRDRGTLTTCHSVTEANEKSDPTV